MENIPEDLKVEIAKKTVPKIEVILGKNYYGWIHLLLRQNQMETFFPPIP